PALAGRQPATPGGELPQARTAATSSHRRRLQLAGRLSNTRRIDCFHGREVHCHLANVLADLHLRGRVTHLADHRRAAEGVHAQPELTQRGVRVLLAHQAVDLAAQDDALDDHEDQDAEHHQGGGVRQHRVAQAAHHNQDHDQRNWHEVVAEVAVRIHPVADETTLWALIAVHEVALVAGRHALIDVAALGLALLALLGLELLVFLLGHGGLEFLTALAGFGRGLWTLVWAAAHAGLALL